LWYDSLKINWRGSARNVFLAYLTYYSRNSRDSSQASSEYKYSTVKEFKAKAKFTLEQTTKFQRGS
jgi:hypothetical protein